MDRELNCLFTCYQRNKQLIVKVPVPITGTVGNGNRLRARNGRGGWNKLYDFISIFLAHKYAQVPGTNKIWTHRVRNSKPMSLSRRNPSMG